MYESAGTSPGGPPPFPDDVPHAPLPVISLDKLAADDESETERMFEACKEMGFFYLELGDSIEGKGLWADVNAVFDLGPKLASMSREEKEKVKLDHDVLGYRSQDHIPGGNRTYSFNLLSDDLLSTPPAPLRCAPPPFLENEVLLRRYAKRANAVGNHVLKHLERSLHIQPGSLTSIHPPIDSRPGGSHSSFLITPPANENDRRRAFNPHTDHGTLTLVFHRVVGGLQILSPQENNINTKKEEQGVRWTYVRPKAGCVIVNMGDTAYQMSRGILRSAIHRVVAPPGEQSRVTRYSLAYFLYTADDCVVRDMMTGNPEAEKVLEQHREAVHEDGELDGVFTEAVTMGEWVNRRMVTGMVKQDAGKDTQHVAPGVWGKKQRQLVEVAEMADAAA